jgi:hypothetical protein
MSNTGTEKDRGLTRLPEDFVIIIRNMEPA